ncbi:hypothetical protein OG921_04365 [Aldersonia sp. NBC_00410]|uniref:hypothetical protein n=1 Tax=Aldersonia sp. NBC_00410 TaxID=2975954 RepID=UPI00225514CA|nr:hypothetical protein [Aldersonia sp. NBC_00410]MCX5042414.1 hypothetical protein [Aldersonia sp. NBC_00410]
MARDVPDDNPLTPAEQLDSDEVRNDDGDTVVDPPEQWIDAEENETLDERLAAEVPDVGPDDIDPTDADAIDPDMDTDDESIQLQSNDAIDRLDPTVHGRTDGQIDGTPEDGDSFFDIEK